MSRSVLSSTFAVLAITLTRGDHPNGTSHYNATSHHGGHGTDHGSSSAETGYDEGAYHMHAIGYTKIPSDFRVGGSFLWDLSGLTNDHGDSNLTYYAIGDTLYTSNKSIFELPASM